MSYFRAKIGNGVHMDSGVSWYAEGCGTTFLAIIPHPFMTDPAFKNSQFIPGENSTSGIVKRYSFWLVPPGEHYDSTTQKKS